MVDMGALAAAAAAKANHRKGIPSASTPSNATHFKKKQQSAPLDALQSPRSKKAAKNAVAAALASKLGGSGIPRGPPQPPPPASRTSQKTTKQPTRRSRQQQSSQKPNNLSVSVPTKLCSSDENIAAQYRKMLKLGLPPGAVRHKMAADGVSENIVQSVISGGADNAGAARGSAVPEPPRQVRNQQAKKMSSLSPQEEKIATQYRKMLTLGLPEGAVRHKMTADAVSSKIVESVIACEVPASSASHGAASTSGDGNSSRIQLPAASAAAIAATSKRMKKSTKAKAGRDSGPRRYEPEPPEAPKPKPKPSEVRQQQFRTKTTTENPKRMVGTSAVGNEQPKSASQTKPTASKRRPQGIPTTAATTTLSPLNQSRLEKRSTNAPTARESNILLSPVNQSRLKKTTGKFSTSFNNGQTQQDGEKCLSSSDEKIAAPFLKMKKLGIPEKALRQKMTAEDVPKRIMDSILPPPPPTPAPSQPRASDPSLPTSSRSPPSRKGTHIVTPVTSERRAEEELPQEAARDVPEQTTPPFLYNAPTPAPIPSLGVHNHGIEKSSSRKAKKQQTEYIDEANPIAVVLSPATKSKRSKKQPILLENGADPTAGRKMSKKKQATTYLLDLDPSKSSEDYYSSDDDDYDDYYSDDSSLGYKKEKRNWERRRTKKAMEFDHDADCHCVVM